MRYYEEDTRFATLRQALENETVDELKKLLALFPIQERPTRKAAILDSLVSRMQSDTLPVTWRRLDNLQQAAVATVAYAMDSRYNEARFIAKYSKEPSFGTKDQRYGYSYGFAPSLLGMFLQGGILPEDLKALLKSLVPAPHPLTLKTAEGVSPVYDLITRLYDYQAKKQIEESTPLAVTQGAAAIGLHSSNGRL